MRIKKRFYSRSKFACLQGQICDDDKRFNAPQLAAEPASEVRGSGACPGHNIFYLCLTALGIAATFSALAGCSSDKDVTVEPCDDVYEPALGFAADRHAPDTGMKIDGVLDESVYTADGHKWYNGLKIDGGEIADLDMTAAFGDEGIYIAFDVTERTNRVYYNPNRDSWLNSGVEMYFALGGTTSIDTPQAFEVDMVCSGKLAFKRRFMDGWVDAATTYDVSPVYAAKTKGGSYNTAACTGYTGELFIPYDYLVKLGVLEKDVKPDTVYANPALITSYSYEGTLRSDRNWYNMAAADTDGDGWANPSMFFHFDENGFVSHDLDIETEGEGRVYTDKDYNFAVADNSLTLNIEAADGYTLDSLTVNSADAMGEITYKDYKARLFMPTVIENLKIKAVFKKTSDRLCLVSGGIVPSGAESCGGVSDMRVKYFDGFKYGDIRTVNGRFAGYVPSGEQELVVVSAKDGYEITRLQLNVTENVSDLSLDVNDTMYGSKRAIRFDGVALAGGKRTVELNNPLTSEKFVFSFRMGVGIDGAHFPSDKYVENFRLLADNGDYITFQLVRWGGSFSTKVFLKNHDDQNLGGIGDALTETADQNGYLDFVLVRDRRELTAYARDKSDVLVKLGTASLYDSVKDTAINKYELESAEGVTPDVGVGVENCVIYQGTTDLSVLNNQ